jgi:hypothetical protein
MARKSTSKLFEDEVKTDVTEESMNAPVTEEERAETEAEKPADDIQDIDLSVIQKKRFRINGDNSKILELNTSDMRIASRLKEAYPRLNTLMDEVADEFNSIPDDAEDEETLTKVADAVDKIDGKMREEIDYIFDANVSEVCGSDGSMWDPIDGMFRYEHIIDKLAKLYENNLDKEFADMKRRVETKAGKYVKLQDHNKKAK